MLDAGSFPGSYYLMGYAIECAIKAAIAKKTKRHDFPDKQLVLDSYTHDLKTLFQIAGLWKEFQTSMHRNSSLNNNWAIAKDWREVSRYDATISEQQARNLYMACTARTNGLLLWLKSYW